MITRIDGNKQILTNTIMVSNLKGTTTSGQQFFTVALGADRDKVFENKSILGKYIEDGGITTTQIASNTITDSNISLTAGIQLSKLADYTKLVLTDANNILSGNNSFTGTIVVPDPALDGQAVNLGYLNTQLSTLSSMITEGVITKQPVYLCTTEALPTNTYNGTAKTLTASANGVLSIDGVTLVTGDIGKRVLVNDETNQVLNGIYNVTSVGSVSTPWVLTRAVDFNGTPDGEVIKNLTVTVESGSTNANSVMRLTETDSLTNIVTVDTNTLEFTLYLSVADIQAGLGLVRNGTTLDVDLATLSGLEFDLSNQLKAKVDGTTIRINGTTGALEVIATALGSTLDGVGLSWNGSTLELDVNYDNTSIGINGSDQLTIKADGVTKTHLNVDVVNVSGGLKQETDGSLSVDINTVITNSFQRMIAPVARVEDSPDVVYQFDILNSAFIADKEMVILNGMVQTPGAGNDYVKETWIDGTDTKVAIRFTRGDITDPSATAIVRMNYFAK